MKGLTFTSSAALHNNDSRSCVLVVVRVIVEVVGNGATQPGPPAESAQKLSFHHDRTPLSKASSTLCSGLKPVSSTIFRAAGSKARKIRLKFCAGANFGTWQGLRDTSLTSSKSKVALSLNSPMLAGTYYMLKCPNKQWKIRLWIHHDKINRCKNKRRNPAWHQALSKVPPSRPLSAHRESTTSRAATPL